MFDRAELVPGGQTNFNLFRPATKQPREDALTLTLQFIYRRGPTAGPHQELIGGVNMGIPLNAREPDDRPVNFTPFVQLMDVDRLGALGLFHFWQPYGQIGAQFTAGEKVNPTLTFSAFPINLGFDLGKHLSISFAGGFLGGWNIREHQLSAGAGFSFGISAKSSLVEDLFIIPPIF